MDTNSKEQVADQEAAKGSKPDESQSAANFGLVHDESQKMLQMFQNEMSQEALSPSFNLPSPGNDLDLFNQMLAGVVAEERKARFSDLPHNVVQSKILMLFTSRELFKLRLVSTEWCDLIKTIWCQVVKEEMLAQVQNLDLLYEKETTSKILEFKMKYLVSYAQLMRNYFVNMVFADICQELKTVDEAPENADLENLGAKLVLIVHLIVQPKSFDPIPETIGQITEEHLRVANEAVQTPEFLERFRGMCQMDVIPDVTLNQIKIIKGNLIDPLLTERPDAVQRLGNAGRLLNSWVDGVLEYTILKHEVVVLRLKSKKVVEQIQTVSQIWPKKKAFIEGAYKLLLFSKGQRPYATVAIQVFKSNRVTDHKMIAGSSPDPHSNKEAETDDGDKDANSAVPIIDKSYFDYSEAFGRVMKSWYEKRIKEESEKNVKLQELHNSLMQIRDLQVRQAQMNKMGVANDQIVDSTNDGSAGAPTNEQNATQVNIEEVEQKLIQQQAMQKEIEELRSKIHHAQNQIKVTRSTIEAQKAMIDQAKQLTAQANQLCGEVNTMRDQLQSLRTNSDGIQHRQVEQRAEPQQQVVQPQAEQVQQQERTQQIESTEQQETQNQSSGQETASQSNQQQIVETAPSEVKENQNNIQQFLNAEPAHQQTGPVVSYEIQGSSLAEEGQIDSSSRQTQVVEARNENLANQQANRTSVQNNDMMQSILQVGGLFGKSPNEESENDRKKQNGRNASDEEDLASSSDSDGETNRQQNNKQNNSNSCTNCSTSADQVASDKKKKSKKESKKPEKLSKQLFEILLRKRIFLTDRFEKIEKSLIIHGVINGKQLANQQVEMIQKAHRQEFEHSLTSKLSNNNYEIINPENKDEKEQEPKEIKEEQFKASQNTQNDQATSQAEQPTGTSLVDEQTLPKRDGEKPILAVAIRQNLQNASKEDNWYELYKSITNEKDMAEKDQQRMIRRERRRIRRKQKLRKERIEAIMHTLKIRKAYRKRHNIKMVSTSVDRYHDYTDREYEQRLVNEQIQLRQQIVAQHQNNQNIQNVLMGLAAVRMLLDTAASTTGATQSAQNPQQTGPQDGPTIQQFQAALQAEQFLQTAQQQISNIMGNNQLIPSAQNDQDEQPDNNNQSAASQLTRQGAVILQNPIQFVAQARNQSGEDMATQTEQVDMAVQTDEPSSSAVQTEQQNQDPASNQ